MKSTFAAIVAVAATVISAQSNIASITSPLAGTVYTAGQPAMITWIDQTVDVIPKIVLAKGLPTSLQPVATIAQKVDANTGAYVWNVPSDTAAGDDYALELGNSPNISFSGLFTIKNDGSSSDSISTAAPNATSPAESSTVIANELVAESAGMKNKANLGVIAVAGTAATLM